MVVVVVMIMMVMVVMEMDDDDDEDDDDDDDFDNHSARRCWSKSGHVHWRSSSHRLSCVSRAGYCIQTLNPKP